MSTARENYRQSEDLIRLVRSGHRFDGGAAEAAVYVSLAQVYATLAVAAATDPGVAS